MSKSNSFETSILSLIFNATPIADLADNDQSTPATTLTVALHTADPGEAGDMSTNETAYTNYARQTVSRNAAGWTVSGNSVSPANNIDFPECGVTGGNNITHFSVGSGVGNNMIYSGTVSPNIQMAAGVVPRIKAAGTTISED